MDIDAAKHSNLTNGNYYLFYARNCTVTVNQTVSGLILCAAIICGVLVLTWMVIYSPEDSDCINLYIQYIGIIL